MQYNQIFESYLNLLNWAEKAASKKQYAATKELLNSYYEERKKNESSFQAEVDAYAEEGSGTMSFMWDERLLESEQKDLLEKKAEEVKKKLSSGLEQQLNSEKTK